MFIVQQNLNLSGTVSYKIITCFFKQSYEVKAITDYLEVKF